MVGRIGVFHGYLQGSILLLSVISVKTEITERMRFQVPGVRFPSAIHIVEEARYMQA
jgi:hypothetical protein